MHRIVTWNRFPWLLALGSTIIVAGCDAPTSPVADGGADAQGVAVYQSKNVDKATGLQPSDPPSCPEVWDEGRKLCRAEVITKHGNDKGLPVNLNGVLNGNQKSGSGASLMVTVLGTLEFNLAAVDLNTVKAGDVANERIPLTPVTLLSNGKHQASIVDVNGDGILDLVLHFNIPAMVANGDLSGTTTELCLYGEGPGYVINGCGVGGGDGDGDGGNEPPPPYYSTLDDCGFDRYKAGRGYRCAIIQLFGKDADVVVSVLQTKRFWTPDHESEGFPEWNTIGADALIGQENGAGRAWDASVVPFGTDNSGVNFLLGTCGLVPSDFRWSNTEQLLVRTDLYVPPEAQNVQIEFIVDDRARVFFNGTELTRDWSVGQEDRSLCRTYSLSTTLTVPQELLSPDGMNKLGVWASDSGGYVNYLDFRVFAEVPQT